MDKGKIAEVAFDILPDVIRVVRELVAGGRSPEEILAHLRGLGPAARPDVDSVALAEAARIRGERG